MAMTPSGTEKRFRHQNMQCHNLDADGTLDVAGAATFSGAVAGKAGATAGWAFATNDSTARLPAAQTASTLVVGIPMEVGDTLTAVGIQGQVESAGGNVTCVLSVRKGTMAAADITDTELATDNVGTLTADTILSEANLGVTGLTEVLAVDEYVYVLLTGTTAAATDIAVASIVATVTKS